MTHREDPDRGIWTSECHFCGATTRCRLVMYGDRYLWKCIGDCSAITVSPGAFVEVKD
jgi:hypothetical protein